MRSPRQSPDRRRSDGFHPVVITLGLACVLYVCVPGRTATFGQLWNLTPLRPPTFSPFGPLWLRGGTLLSLRY